MAFVFNPITGGLDIVDLPENVDTSIPTLQTNGDLHLVYVGGIAYVYWRSQGVTYYAVATTTKGSPIGYPNLGLTYNID